VVHCLWIERISIGHRTSDSAVLRIIFISEAVKIKNIAFKRY
jgi:hypothetical protein